VSDPKPTIDDLMGYPPAPAAEPERKPRKRVAPKPGTSEAQPRAPAVAAPKRKRSNREIVPGAPLPATFEEALGRLSDDERNFVRAHLSNPSRGAAGAYRVAINPAAKASEATSKGGRILARAAVKMAITLGRESVAREVALATKHDVQASFVELGEIMDEARGGMQYNAAVKAAETRAKLTGALVERSESRQFGGFTFRIEGLPEKGRTIEATPEPVTPAEQKKEQDEDADE